MPKLNCIIDVQLVGVSGFLTLRLIFLLQYKIELYFCKNVFFYWFMTCLKICTSWRHAKRNFYHRRKWNRWPEVKTWTRPYRFHLALMHLRKAWVNVFFRLQWIYSRAVWDFKPWLGNQIFKLWEMQTSRIGTRIIVSSSYDDNPYTTTAIHVHPYFNATD